MVGNPFDKQVENRNFLSPLGFKFTLNRAPKVAFFGNSANIPSMTLGVAVQTNYLKDIDTPGDKIVFEDFKNFLRLRLWPIAFNDFLNLCIGEGDIVPSEI